LKCTSGEKKNIKRVIINIYYNIFITTNRAVFELKIKFFAKTTYCPLKAGKKFEKFSNFFYFSVDIFEQLKYHVLREDKVNGRSDSFFRTL
jgi:hypothetical protein